ncbi:molecular chaperone DnaJ [Candidatus Woesearchaeota archaeon]|nr:molecular chaperone DnaJ [Candidatus Woesearchaeota archaeon]
MKDYYTTLGVSRNAGRDEIKKAYKTLAKKYHPDLNKEAGAAEKFKEITEAYDVLTNDQKKQHYDQFGTTEEQQQHEGYSPFSDFGFDMSDVFEGFFGGKRRSRHVRGSDIAYDMDVTLEDAASGKKKRVTIHRMEQCTACSGKGAARDDDIKQCSTCNGSGYAKRTIRTPFGYFSQTSPCTTCQGEGTVLVCACSECDGLGRVRKERQVEVEIPAGIMSGFKLRISGGGDAGVKGGPSGDLYFVVMVREHKLFERDGQDIIIKVPISVTLAALGGEIEVPTLFGKEMVSIPAGTQTHTAFKLKGKGLPSLQGSGAGHEIVYVIVETPTKLTQKQKELLMEFDKTYTPKKSLLNRLFS